MRSVGQRIAVVAPQRVAPSPKRADPHYATPEHAAWRAQVLRAAHYRCEGLGCGAAGVRLFADHVVELRDGGKALDPANGQALCGACHARKTAAARAQRHGLPMPPHQPRAPARP